MKTGDKVEAKLRYGTGKNQKLTIRGKLLGFGRKFKNKAHVGEGSFALIKVAGIKEVIEIRGEVKNLTKQ